ncbi:MAG TPA: hypothetical protein P5287_03910, partial [bacterium]|nr:hypothetical protein [bacterium]
RGLKSLGITTPVVGSAAVLSEQMTLNEVKASILPDLAVRYAKLGQPAEAMSLILKAYQMAKGIKDSRLRMELGLKIAQAYVDSKNGAEAEKLLANLRSDAAHLADLQFQAQALAEIADTHGKMKQYGQSLAVIKEIKDPQIAVIAYLSLADLIKSSGSSQDIVPLIADASAAARQIGDGNSRDDAFCRIAFRYADEGKFNEALQHVAQTANAGIRAFALAHTGAVAAKAQYASTPEDRAMIRDIMKSQQVRQK